MRACHSGNRKVCVVRIIYVDGWYWSTLDRGCQQRVVRVLAKCRQPIDHLAGDYRSTHESVNTPPTIACCWSSVDHVSVDMSTEGWQRSIVGRSRCRSLVSINTRLRVSLVHMIPSLLITKSNSFSYATNWFRQKHKESKLIKCIFMSIKG